MERAFGGGVGTWTTGDARSNAGCTYIACIDTGVWYAGVGSTLEDEAHRLGQVIPRRTQQLHVQVMRPAKAHVVKTNTVTKYWGRMRIESARHARYCHLCYGHHDTVLLGTVQGGESKDTS